MAEALVYIGKGSGVQRNGHWPQVWPELAIIRTSLFWRFFLFFAILVAVSLLPFGARNSRAEQSVSDATIRQWPKL